MKNTLLVSATLLGLSSLDGAAGFGGPATRAAVQPRARLATMQFGFGGGGKTAAGAVPKGWKKVPSQSRPGQFSYQNLKTGQRYDRIPQSEFFDDELDTTKKPLWDFREAAGGDRADWEKRGFRSAQEAAGFDENGNDLANSGGIIYLATVPFLLFALSYLGGALGSPYKGGGNF